MNIYIANLHSHVDENQLKEAFSPFGSIDSAKVIVDLRTGISKGYGFVSMPDNEHAHKAIADLSGTSILGTSITVKEANPAKVKKPQAPRAMQPKKPERTVPVFDMTEGLSFDGKIKFFNSERKYGFIVSSDNQDIFFPQESLNDINRIPKIEEPVRFKVKNSARGPIAADIDLKA